jgi:hypothetical protein
MARSFALAGAALLIASGSAAGQGAPAASSRPGLLSFGTRFGGAFTELARDYQAPTRAQFAPVAGLFLEAHLTPFFSVSVDALYAEYGGKAVSPEPLYGTVHPALKNLRQMNLGIRALEFPVQAKFSASSVGGNVIPYVSAGASLAKFLTTRSYNYRQVQWGGLTSPRIVSLVEVDMSDAMQSTDMAGLIATGLDVHSRQLSWSVEAYYRMGLSEVNKLRVLGETGYTSNAVGIKIGVSTSR